MRQMRMLVRRKASLLFALAAALGLVAGLAALLAGCALTSGPTPTPTKTPRVGPARTFTATPARVALATATQGAPSPTQTASPTRSPTATATQLPPTATDTPAPTATQTATSTPTDTATATPSASPRPSSTRPPARPATAVPTVSPLAARNWDPRLTQRGAQLIPAQVKAGQGYWRLIDARWFDEGEEPFNGKHHAFIDALNQSGARQTGVHFQMYPLEGSDVLGDAITEAKPGEPYAANFPMFAVAPAYRVRPADGSPADAVSGLGLGSLASPGLPTLTSYGLTWQWTIMR